MRSDIPTLADQILRGNAERAEAGLGPSVNLVALGIGNGCSGTESASCGSRPSATTFAETDEGITLRFLRDHALLSAEVFDGVHSACSHVTGANPLSRFRDCYVHVPWDGLTPEPEHCRGPYSNSSTPDNNVTCPDKHGAQQCYHLCPLPANASDPNAACCSALNYEEGVRCWYFLGLSARAVADPKSMNIAARAHRHLRHI